MHKKGCYKNSCKPFLFFFFFVPQMQTLKKHLSVKTETDCGALQHISLLGKHSWYSIFALCLMFFPRIFWLNMVMMDDSSHVTVATNTRKSYQRWSRCTLLLFKSFCSVIHSWLDLALVVNQHSQSHQPLRSWSDFIWKKRGRSLAWWFSEISATVWRATFSSTWWFWYV